MSNLNNTIEPATVDYFSRKLKLFRKQKNMTQQELADKACISRNALIRYEKGDRVPNVEILSNIAKALEINPISLYPPSEILASQDTVATLHPEAYTLCYDFFTFLVDKDINPKKVSSMKLVKYFADFLDSKRTIYLYHDANYLEQALSKIEKETLKTVQDIIKSHLQMDEKQYPYRTPISQPAKKQPLVNEYKQSKCSENGKETEIHELAAEDAERYTK